MGRKRTMGSPRLNGFCRPSGPEGQRSSRKESPADAQRRGGVEVRAGCGRTPTRTRGDGLLACGCLLRFEYEYRPSG